MIFGKSIGWVTNAKLDKLIKEGSAEERLEDAKLCYGILKHHMQNGLTNNSSVIGVGLPKLQRKVVWLFLSIGSPGLCRGYGIFG